MTADAAIAAEEPITAREAKIALRAMVDDLVAQGHDCRMGLPTPRSNERHISFTIDPGPPLLAVRSAHMTEGRATEEMDLSRNPHRDHLQAWMNDLRSLLEADAAILAAGGDPMRAGPEHHVAHPLVFKAAEAYGWTPAEIAEPMLVHMGGRWSMTHNSRGVYTPLLTTEGDGFSVSFERVLRRRRVLCERLMFVGIEAGRMAEIRETGEGLHLVLRGRSAPHTVLAAMAGQRVGDVVEWAALDFLKDEPIASARIEEADGSATVILDLGPGAAALPAIAW